MILFNFSNFTHLIFGSETPGTLEEPALAGRRALLAFNKKATGVNGSVNRTVA